MKEYRVGDDIFFTVENNNGAFLRYSADTDAGIDAFSVGISNNNLNLLISEFEKFNNIKWKTSDGSLTVRGSENNIKLIFKTEHPPFSINRSLSITESESFIYALKEIVRKNSLH